MKSCHGNGRDHCCWFRGVLCPYLEEDTIKGRKWACALLRELKDWDLVLDSEEYKSVVIPMIESIPELEGMNCRDYPYGEKTCCYGDRNPPIHNVR
jgi:hypothetical protein